VPSTAVDDYLKSIFAASEWDADAHATVGGLADKLEVTPGSVSAMVRKLADLGYVEHARYRGIALTADGREHALQVVRRHRLLETFLVGTLGYGWDEVHDEAEVLEHAVSPLLVDRMDAALGRPWRDPHGDPIPTADGVLHQPPVRRIDQLGVGESGYVVRISDTDAHLLRYLGEHGIELDSRVEVLGEPSYSGGVGVGVRAVDGEEHRVDLGRAALKAVLLAPEPPAADRLPGGCAYPCCRHQLAGQPLP